MYSMVDITYIGVNLHPFVFKYSIKLILLLIKNKTISFKFKMHTCNCDLLLKHQIYFKSIKLKI